MKLLFGKRESLLVHPETACHPNPGEAGRTQDSLLVAVELGFSIPAPRLARRKSDDPRDHAFKRSVCHSACKVRLLRCPIRITRQTGLSRGFGVLQSAFAIESMMDILAHKLGLDPLELRKINALHTGSLTNTNQLLESSVGLPDCLQTAVEYALREAAGQNLLPPGASCAAASNMLRCWGVAAAYKNTGLGSGADDDAGAAA